MERINALDDSFKGQPLGVLFRLVHEQSTKEQPEDLSSLYDGLAIPETVDERKNLLVRLLDMFCVSSSGNFNAAQLEQMRAALERAMPDPEKDPLNFLRFVQDRCHGAFEMLRMLVVLQGNQKPRHQQNFSKQEVINEALKFGEPVVTESGSPQFLRGLKGPARDQAMHPRVERLKFIYEIGPIATFKKFNAAKLPEVMKLFEQHQLKNVVAAIIEIFTDRAEEFALQSSPAPDYAVAHWFANLLNKLATYDLARADTAQNFAALLEGMKNAQDPENFTAAIDGFAPIEAAGQQ